jgi:hypothetical protein
MHARLDRGSVRLLTRTGLDWTHGYRVECPGTFATLGSELASGASDMLPITAVDLERMFSNRLDKNGGRDWD